MARGGVRGGVADSDAEARRRHEGDLVLGGEGTVLERTLKARCLNRGKRGEL